MANEIQTIRVDDVEYVRKDSIKGERQEITTDEFVIARGQGGVYMGYLKKRTDFSVTLRDARKLWKWAGAQNLNDLSQNGTNKPQECRFPPMVDEIILTGQWFEIQSVTPIAKKSLMDVPVWTKF